MEVGQEERMTMTGNGGMEEGGMEEVTMGTMPSSMGMMDEPHPCGRAEETTGVKEGMCVWNWILILLVASVMIGAIVKATSSSSSGKGAAGARRSTCKYSLR